MDAIDTVEKRLTGKMTPEELNVASKSLNIDFQDMCEFQEIKSLAVANGILTPQEGSEIYCRVGHSPKTFNNQPFCVKYGITAIIASVSKQLTK